MKCISHKELISNRKPESISNENLKALTHIHELVIDISQKDKPLQGYCPFLATSIINNTVWYKIVPSIEKSFFNSIIDDEIKQFHDLPVEPEKSKYKTKLLIFPNYNIESVNVFLESIEKLLKIYITKHKIVVGGFLSKSKEFVVIIRPLVEQDLSFLKRTLNLEDREIYLSNYIKLFEDTNLTKYLNEAKIELKALNNMKGIKLNH